MGGGGCCVGNFPCPKCGLIQKIKDFFCSNSCCIGDGIKDDDKIDTSNLASIAKLQKSLDECRADARERSENLENEVINESRESLDSFIKDLEKYNNIHYGRTRLNINVNHIQRENRKTEDKIHGFIVKRVIKRVSLDDDECKKILEMDKGNEKKEKFNEFYRKVLKESVLELSGELKDGIEEQTERVCETIQRRIDSIVDVCENKAEEFEKIRQVKEKDETAVEQEQLRLTHFIAMCEYGLEILG